MAAIRSRESLIEDAQKYAMRGQLDKAVKAYEQILALDPAAVNLRQKLAELLVKSGKNEDARKELETIGKYYSKNGFYLKAIAVYKQLQKLFPSDITMSVTLAELNEKHGLIANALTEYKLVYDYHSKAGSIEESLAVLDKMQRVDPLNASVKLKLAEEYFKQGRGPESYLLFSVAASLLIEQSDRETLSRLCSRMAESFPEKREFMQEILAEQIEKGHASIVIEHLGELIRTKPQSAAELKLLARAYFTIGEDAKSADAWNDALRISPSDCEAMSGALKVATARDDLQAALELLSRYEADLARAGLIEFLADIYADLEKLDPLNRQIIQGALNVAEAKGEIAEIESLSEKLATLDSVSGLTVNATGFERLDGSFSEFSFAETGFADPDPPLACFNTSDDIIETEEIDLLEEIFEEEIVLPHFPSDPGSDLEIEIEIDLDITTDGSRSENFGGINEINRSNSLSDLFENIATAPRGVRFAKGEEKRDLRSHYELGQAFREMGLYDEAISELRGAIHDPEMAVKCMILQCACLRERGDLEKSISTLQALLLTDLTPQDTCSAKHELAIGYEANGNRQEARRLFDEIKASCALFEGTASASQSAFESIEFTEDDLKNL